MPVAVGPSRTRAWRTSRLGGIAERLEHGLLLDLAGPVRGLSVLDVGCGDGRLVEVFSRHGADVTGIDADPAMVEAAGLTTPFGAVLRGDALALPFADARFDLVTMVTVLCHVENPGKALAEARRVLKPGGRLLLWELGRASLWAAIRRLRGWAGNGFWRSARFFAADDLATLAATAGLAVDSVRGGVYFPPCGWAASLLAPLDGGLSRLTTIGAAFLAVSAHKPE